MRTNTQYCFLLFCFVLFCNVCFSQKKVKIRNVSGTSISLDLTPKQALKEAVREAKINALAKAGIGEQVGVLRVLLEESKDADLKQYFNEISTSELNADIVVDSIYSEKRDFDKHGNMIVTVSIDATVLKYNKKRDPSFFFDVKGLKDIYYDNERVSFTFKPSRDGYLKIFALNDKESVLLYPYKNPATDHLSDTDNHLFKTGETVSFPVHDAYKPGYFIDVDEGNETENSLLVFVFTKDNFSWVEDVNKKTIYTRIANIPPDRRIVKYFPIVLKTVKN